MENFNKDQKTPPVGLRDSHLLSSLNPTKFEQGQLVKLVNIREDDAYHSDFFKSSVFEVVKLTPEREWLVPTGFYFGTVLQTEELGGGGTWYFHAARFRLATPEEIAQAKALCVSAPKAADAPPEPVRSTATNQMFSHPYDGEKRNVVMELLREEATVRREVARYFGVQGEHLDFLLSEFSRLGLILCGGTVTSIFTEQPVNDLDFYMRDPNSYKTVTALFTSLLGEPIFASANAVTYKRKSEKSNKKWTVQLITRFTGSPQDIFRNFDFTITNGAYCFDSRQFELGPRFLPDLAQRRLVYAGDSKYPICAMYRTKKYQSRGFSLSGATIMHIALSIVQLKISTYAELKDQLMGIDTLYLQGLLSAKSPDAPVDYGEFVFQAFQAIDGITGKTPADTEDHDSDL